jgi:hypothetical protein
MMIENAVSRKAAIAAAVCCIFYIVVQCFQQYVYTAITPPANAVQELLQGAMPLHKVRAFLLLLSFFPMMYIFICIIYHDFNRNKLLYTFALMGLLIFCFLEIGLRSVEYFYIQTQLPAQYQHASGEAVKNSIIAQFNVFQSVQQALYFPLMFAQCLASVIIAFIFPSAPRLTILVKAAFSINAFRLAGRLIAMFTGVTWFDSFSDGLYLPFVIAIFGMLAGWFGFVKAKK